MEESATPKIVNIVPLGKGKRILAFLADFFINFIFSFALFNMAVFPLGKLMTGFTGHKSENDTALVNRAQVLYDNHILFESKDVASTDIEYNASFTFNCFLSYYALDEENPTYTSYTQYGHKNENEIFRHYFTDIASDISSYYRLFDLYNQSGNYFTRTDDVITLKAEIKEKVAVYFHKGESISSEGSSIMSQMESTLFYPLYGEVMTLINKNDLKSGDLSYLTCQNTITSFDTYYRNLNIACSFITLAFSSAICYLLVPFISKNRKTLGLLAMRLERVDIRSLSLLKKKRVFLLYIYALLTNLLIVLFTPIGALTIYEIFAIPALWIFGLFGVLFSLCSLVYLLFNAYNQSLFDYLSRIVYLTSDGLDDIYRARGYEI